MGGNAPGAALRPRGPGRHHRRREQLFIFDVDPSRAQFGRQRARYLPGAIGEQSQASFKLAYFTTLADFI